jgi:alpha-tubulin suppressor-like RCC1 family protein
MKENTPQNVVGLVGVSGTDAGDDHGCAVFAGNVACWGRNDSSQLGIAGGNTSNPTLVAGTANVSQIAGGASHTCALKTDGTALCWGANSSGQLGTGNFTSATAPVSVIAL